MSSDYPPLKCTAESANVGRFRVACVRYRDQGLPSVAADAICDETVRVAADGPTQNGDKHRTARGNIRSGEHCSCSKRARAKRGTRKQNAKRKKESPRDDYAPPPLPTRPVSARTFAAGTTWEHAVAETRSVYAATYCRAIHVLCFCRARASERRADAVFRVSSSRCRFGHTVLAGRRRTESAPGFPPRVPSIANSGWNEEVLPVVLQTVPTTHAHHTPTANFRPNALEVSGPPPSNILSRTAESGKWAQVALYFT